MKGLQKCGHLETCNIKRANFILVNDIQLLIKRVDITNETQIAITEMYYYISALPNPTYHNELEILINKKG